MLIEGLSSSTHSSVVARCRRAGVWWVGLAVLVAALWPAVVGCGGSTPAGTASSTEWAAPSPSILAAFERAAVTVGSPVYVPGELPVGMRLLSGGESALPLESMSAESVVSLALEEGRLDVLQGVQGDLGDVQGVACGTIEGRPAKMFDLLGGHLVQWERDGSWCAVYGLDIPTETLLRVALSMERG